MREFGLRRTVILIFLLLLSGVVHSAQTIYLIRHAEKSKLPANNPVLTEQGMHRAGHIADLLAAADIRVVYSSPYARTRQTAQPIAQRHQLKLSDYDPRQLQALAGVVREDGRNTVVVGHSNTTPRLLNALTGLAFPDMDESEYDSIFQLTLLNDETWQLQTLKSLPRQPSKIPKLSDVVNYVQMTPELHTSGMPTAQHMRHWGAYGFDAVVNLAPHDEKKSVAGEAQAVNAAGADYLNIAVDWENPTTEDFDQFIAFMQGRTSEKVLLHCRKNMRASVFAFLYRVIVLDEDAERVYASVQKVWQPNAVWRAYAQSELKRFDIDFQVP
ncbi:histidine phosphatase family protein [Marinicella sp. W31]|uniref:histidine phosphatase family protein n=1 Tax=Marinicella sp. W31 TaxID=3023713 RepID=UPI003756E744